MIGFRQPCSPERFILVSLRRRSRTVRRDSLRATRTVNWTWGTEQLVVFAGKGCPCPQRSQF